MLLFGMFRWMGLAAVATASNPVVLNTSIADPHIHIFEGRAYMYSGRDLDPTSTQFQMPDWHVWSSDNLVDWHHETTITPGQTYIGANTSACYGEDCLPYPACPLSHVCPLPAQVLAKATRRRWLKLLVGAG